MQFVTIGYGDEAGYERTDPKIRNAAHAHDFDLVLRGAVIGVAGEPVQVRNDGARGVVTQTGAFLRADMPLAGFALLEAVDLDGALEMAASSPCAVAGGVVEVWPLDTLKA